MRICCEVFPSLTTYLRFWISALNWSIRRNHYNVDDVVLTLFWRLSVVLTRTLIQIDVVTWFFYLAWNLERKIDIKYINSLTSHISGHIKWTKSFRLVCKAPEVITWNHFDILIILNNHPSIPYVVTRTKLKFVEES